MPFYSNLGELTPELLVTDTEYACRKVGTEKTCQDLTNRVEPFIASHNLVKIFIH